MEKEELNTLIDNTMNSLEGLERAEVDPSVTESIKLRLSRNKKIIKPAAYIWQLAAVFVVLICVNMFTIFNYLQTVTSDYTRTAALEIMAGEYIITNNNYYY